MFLSAAMLFIYTETPLHAGAGSGLGPVDLPIQRERITNYPIIQASGIKGALRSEATASGADDKEVQAVFGHDDADHAGALSANDARILLFPVRSLTGVYTWTTSCEALARFRRDMKVAGLADAKLPELPTAAPKEGEALATAPSQVLLNATPQGGGSLVLEEFSFAATGDTLVTKWAMWLAEHALPAGDEYAFWRTKMAGGLVVLSDDDFRDFLVHATEIVTRVRLDDETKTVVPGALWTQEHLPADSLLYAPIQVSKLRVKPGPAPAALNDTDPGVQAQNVLAWAANAAHIPHRLQIGGDETVGRGMVALRWQQRPAPAPQTTTTAEEPQL